MNLIEKFKNWFTSEKVKELEKKVKALESKEPVVKYITNVDPYKNKLITKCIYNTNTKYINVIFNDGDVLTGTVDKDIYEKINNAVSKEEVMELLFPKEPEKHKDEEFEKKVEQVIKPIINILSDLDDFEVVGENVFLKGISSIVIPNSIVAEFIRLVSEIQDLQDNSSELIDYEQLDKLKEEYDSLLMFTYKLLLNPMKNSREDCLEYVKKYDIKLTNTGNMIMYRRIVSVDNSNKDLIDFVSKQYVKVKSWKKSPKNYEVVEDEKGLRCVSFGEVHESYKGNLAELYSKLPELQENRYTDDYTRSYDIRIGEVYKIREEDIDVNKHGSCGGALHVADGKVFNYRSFGDTPVAVLVDPRHVYKMDSGHSGKIGVKQMFIMSITEQDYSGNYIDIDSQAVVNFDDLYHNQTIDELQEAFKNKSFEPISVSTEVTELSLKEVVNVTDILKNRIVEIV